MQNEMTNLCNGRQKIQLQLGSIVSAPSTAPCNMTRGLQKVLFVLGNGIQTHICHLELFFGLTRFAIESFTKKIIPVSSYIPPLSVNHIIHDQLLFHYKLHKSGHFVS